MSLDSKSKWALLFVVALINLIWVFVAGFKLEPSFFVSFGWIYLLLGVSLIYFYTGRDQRIMQFAHFGSQILSLYLLLALFNYLIISTNAPLASDTFDTLDKSFGLDWVAWTKWTADHPTIRLILRLAYDSLPVQALFCYVHNTCKGAPDRNSEIWWITFVSATVTILISAVLPAINPYVYYGMENPDHFTHMKIFLELRDGTMSVLKLYNEEGMIQLPSFHTVLAIMFTYNLRHNRWLCAIAVVINTLLILSCPTEGCHYFIDLPAGAVVAVATILVVRRLSRVYAWETVEVRTLVRPAIAKVESYV